MHQYKRVDMIKRRIGSRIKDLRKAHGYESQGALARKLGVEPSTVGRWESGAFMPEPEHQEALAKLFNMPPEEVLDYSREVETPEAREFKASSAELENRLLKLEALVGSFKQDAPGVSVVQVAELIDDLADDGKITKLQSQIAQYFLSGDISCLQGMSEQQVLLVLNFQKAL
jgi:transcriptional regulator with XRE-family HTH domain